MQNHFRDESNCFLPLFCLLFSSLLPTSLSYFPDEIRGNLCKFRKQKNSSGFVFFSSHRHTHTHTQTLRHRWGKRNLNCNQHSFNTEYSNNKKKWSNALFASFFWQIKQISITIKANIRKFFSQTNNEMKTKFLLLQCHGFQLKLIFFPSVQFWTFKNLIKIKQVYFCSDRKR